ncbi:MAG: shikimate dehydrogenase family protein, partial [Bacilli bacterium]
MKKYALIGSNLSYSMSKVIHDYLINYYNVAARYYLIPQPQLDLKVIKEYEGLNITIPFKEEIIGFLNESYLPFPSCNTIVYEKEKDNMIGYNTDIDGFEYLVAALALPHINKVVILGSGATAKMVQYYFSNCEVITISRNDQVFNYEYLNNVQADLLVNTTPVGMQSFVSPIKEELLLNYQGVIDLNYNP